MINHLPEKYKFSHEYALFLHDILVEIVKHGEMAGRFEVKVKFAVASHAEAIAKVPDEEKWDWLEANGYSPASDVLTGRRVIAALLSDFCHFVFEALS
jgi:hypothetical protein